MQLARTPSAHTRHLVGIHQKALSLPRGIDLACEPDKSVILSHSRWGKSYCRTPRLEFGQWDRPSHFVVCQAALRQGCLTDDKVRSPVPLLLCSSLCPTNRS